MASSSPIRAGAYARWRPATHLLLSARRYSAPRAAAVVAPVPVRVVWSSAKKRLAMSRGAIPIQTPPFGCFAITSPFTRGLSKTALSMTSVQRPNPGNFTEAGSLQALRAASRGRRERTFGDQPEAAWRKSELAGRSKKSE